jgi:2-(1,2-epoxy-1,2-dihydrophenyl)acetyl-CoA isomerase
VSVECRVAEGVATLLLNRPEKLNALTADMWLELGEHLDRCQRDDGVRAVILSGAGRGFCAGADISRVGADSTARPTLGGVLESMRGYDAVIRRLYHLRKPVIAAAQGAVIGIAWTLVLCCDWILVTESTRFRPAFLNLAKVPEGGFIYLITGLIGQLRAREITYGARFVSGTEAVELGLANRLVGEDTLMQEALTLAREAATGATLAFALTKQLFNTCAGSFDQFLDLEINAIAIAANTADALEGSMVFREKRDPRFLGR